VPSVVGCDLSSKAIDLVKLDEASNRASWVRCELAGADAWERTLSIREALWLADGHAGSWWDDVYLVAIEKPVNDQQRVLGRVQGAILASLPAALRHPHCCWEVHPSTWKAGLGLKGKPTWTDIERLSGTPFPIHGSDFWAADDQNALDAYALALWARDENAKAVAAALEKDAAA